MLEREIVSINGEIFNLEDGKISVLDHCFLFGDGIFEGIKLIDGKILLHKEHMERLYASAEVLRIPMINHSEYEKMLFSAIKASNLCTGYVRVVVTRGVGALDINPIKCAEPKMVIIVARLKLFPEELYEKGLKIIIARTNKIPYRSFDGRAKSCNYLNNVMAMWEVIDKGFSEAIMTDENGIVSEATMTNIFGVKNKKVFTPSLDTNCLQGITREKILEISEGKNLIVEQGKYTARDFIFADEVFLTGTGAGVIPVTQIEHRIISNGKIGGITRLLRNEYESRLETYLTAIL